MKINKISDKITHILYDTQVEVASAFVRIQEFYESPEFAGKIFTLGIFREWYSKEFGAWTYAEDWSGFNVTDKAFEPFIKGLFDPLTRSEYELVNLMRFKPKPYAIIGTFAKDPDSSTLAHEISHALYYTNNQYRVAVQEALAPYELDLEELKEHIRKLGYAEHVVLDECHAYIGESNRYLDEEKINYPKELIFILKKIKNEAIQNG